MFEMAEVFACLVYVLDASTVSIDVNVSIHVSVNITVPVWNEGP